MRILLDCRPLQKTGLDGERSRLIFSAVTRLAADGVDWLLVTDRHPQEGFFPHVPGDVVVRRALPGRVGWMLWYDRQLPRLVRQEGVDMLWLTGGVAAADCGVPQVCWMPERAEASGAAVAGGAGGGGRYPSIFRARLPVCLERAAAICCFSQRDRAWLAGIRPEAREKIRVAGAFPDDRTAPLTDEEKAEVRARWTGGKEFFMADMTGAREEGVIDLLKAFTLFKRRQHTQMRLVLTGTPGTGGTGGIKERLKTYKFREDVDLPEGGADVRPALSGAAYAVIFPFVSDGLGGGLLAVWKAAVPAIVVNGGLLQEMAGGAAPGFAPGDPASLAAQLMRIYKEEDLRKDLIGKGMERLKLYSGENFQKVLRVITEIAAC